MGGDNTNKRNAVLSLIFTAILPGLLLGNYTLVSGGWEPEGAEILVQGSPLYGANGLMFGDDGYLYIACVLGREIVVMDPDSGEMVRRLTPEDGVDGPDDLAFGPDGSLYWTEIIQGMVGRMNTEGVVEKQFVGRGANSITFSDDGRLFVGLDFLGDAFYEIDPDFSEEPRLIAEGIGMLNAMDFGPDGYLYGPIITQGRIVRIDVDADPFEMTTVADGFQGTPVSVKFDSQGRMHALDQDFGTVYRIDHLTGDMEVVCQLPAGLDNMAFNTDDRLFVSGSHDGVIFEILPDGEYRVVSEGGIVCPFGVAVMPREQGESVFVADMWSIREFDGATGEPLGIKEHGWFFPESITSAMSIATDGEELVISSWFENMVMALDWEADQITESYPIPAIPIFAIRFGGEIVVSQIGTGDVSPAAGGDPLATGIWVPTGMETTDDDLFVCDWYTGNVYRIVTDGEPTMDVVASGLILPEDLAWDLDGSLLVTESGAGRVTAIDLDTGEKTVVVDGLAFGKAGHPNTPPSSQLAGIDVGRLGHIYVSGDLTNVIYRIGATVRISRTIDDLDDGAFRNPERASRTKRRLCHRLSRAQDMIDGENYYAARAILRCTRRKMDGSLTPETWDDRNDMITDPDAQQELLSLVDALMSRIQQQING